MELAQIEAFLQVARLRSFSRAAEALFLTQPSVTARIQTLEREIGERLFERSGRTVSLTDAGRAFMPHAQRAVTAVQEGSDAIDAVRHGEVGSLRLAAASSVGTYVLPAILRRYYDARPQVHVRLSTGATEEVIEHVLDGQVHVALCRLTRHPDVESARLYSDDLALVVPPEHPFVARRRVRLADAARERFLFFERGSSYHTMVYSLFLAIGAVPEAAMEIDSIETTKHMIEAGLGISVLPLSNVKREVAAGYLSTVELTDIEQPPQREVGVHVPRGRAFARPVVDFLRVLFEVYDVPHPFGDRIPADG
jgi:DNA-binding transcriptional LysR family regulator